MNSSIETATKVDRLAALHVINTDPCYSMRCLEASTAHIPRATASELEEGRWEGFYVPWRDCGWIMPVYDTQIEAARFAGHKELAELMQLALEAGFSYLRLDKDALGLPEAFGLPTFDW